MKQLKNNVEADQARSLLIRRGDSIIVKAFKTAAGYADRFGLLAILQLAASIQCDANEECPEHLNSQLDTLLAPGGRFVKTETFYESGVTAWIVAIITYEVKVGDELRVIPLRVRKLPVEVKSLR